MSPVVTSATVSAPADTVIERDGVRHFSGHRAHPVFVSIGHAEKIVARPQVTDSPSVDPKRCMQWTPG